MTEDLTWFPLSDAQRAIWLMQQAMPDTPLNIAQYSELVGDIDVDVLARAGGIAVRNTQFMQVRFEMRGRDVVGVHDPSIRDTAQCIDLRGERDPQGVAEAIMSEDYARTVNPLNDRTVVGIIMRIADDRVLVYNRGHHLVADGLSAKEQTLIGLATYSTVLAGEPVAKAPRVDFALPARLDTEYRSSTRFITDRSYWRETLAGIPALPSLSTRMGAISAIARDASAPICPDTVHTLERAAQKHTTQVPAIIAAAVAAYLSRVTGRDDIGLNLPVAARTTAALRRTPLPVANVALLRTHVGPGVTVHEALRTTQSAMLGALRHQRYRYDDVRADLAATGNHVLGVRGLSGVTLNLMLFDREIRCGDATATFHVLTSGPVDDLFINIYPSTDDGGLVVDLEANPNRYDEAEVAQHHRGLLEFLGDFVVALVERPETIIDDLPLAGAAPMGPPEPVSETQTLPEILRAAAREHPDSVAVDGGDKGGRLTYRELDARASELASRLVEEGARPGVVVALVMGRLVAQTVAWWAVAYTGATILLADPRQPVARVRRVLKLARAVVMLEVGPGGVVAIRNLAPGGSDATRPAKGDGRESGVGGVVSIRGLALGGSDATRPAKGAGEMAVAEATGGCNSVEGARGPRLDDAAYVVFTSGTTGEPKGIAVPHRGLSALCEALAGPFVADEGGGNRLAGMASPAFDAVHTELLAAANQGLCLVPIELVKMSV